MTKRQTRYLLFGWEAPQGGGNDFMGFFGSVEEARQAHADDPLPHAEIYEDRDDDLYPAWQYHPLHGWRPFTGERNGAPR